MKELRKVLMVLGMGWAMVMFGEEVEEPRSWVRSPSSDVSVSYQPVLGAGN
ncbi:hypothetical protein [Thermospira aquatica]|uniref:Uncharacterized protein n=1 Tax=Thermospira aquatica TaxID=2828656 RepID=A0AAX3BGI3_9SPIR|nr:hypothetical protein [Thermospira aquatica]URA11260.1 hypothetical protein KDW03_05540 [Thermospira aquatica]